MSDTSNPEMRIGYNRVSDKQHRMTDERLADIEAVGGRMHPMEILNTYNELLQALKAERERIAELEAEKVELLATIGRQKDEFLVEKNRAFNRWEAENIAKTKAEARLDAVAKVQRYKIEEKMEWRGGADAERVRVRVEHPEGYYMLAKDVLEALEQKDVTD